MKSTTLAVACLFLLVGASAHAAELKVEVLGVEKAEGQVLVALYDEQGYLKKLVKGLRLPARVGSVAGSFGDVPEGSYAVTAFLDENTNGKLDFDSAGMPAEKMGFSNDAIDASGPPPFAAARFRLDGASKSIVITLR